MKPLWTITRVAGHLLMVTAAVVVARAATSHVTYSPLRHASITLVLVLAAVWMSGRLPWGLGPVSESVPARLVRIVGTVLAGMGAAGAILGLAQGDSPAERASSGVPIYTGMLALYLAAFLAATRRGTALPPRPMLIGVGLGLLAAGLFAVAVAVLPAGLVAVALLLIAGAGAGAVWLARPAESRFLAGLLAVVTASQALFYAAAVMYRFGPDVWMPYAGPGPLTLQGQLDQNRAEAIDPYVGQLFLGVLAAAILVGVVVTAQLRARAETATLLHRTIHYGQQPGT